MSKDNASHAEFKAKSTGKPSKKALRRASKIWSFYVHDGVITDADRRWAAEPAGSAAMVIYTTQICRQVES